MMRYRGVPDSLVELAECARAGDDFALLVGNFIDLNKGLVKRDRKEEAASHFLVVPPLIGKAVENGTALDAFLAAMTEKLFRDWGMGEPPAWVQAPERFLDHPHYSVQTSLEEFKARLRAASPEPFRKRNLFYSDRVLDRC